MHEISLVRNIIATLKNEFPDKFFSIQNIYLRVGELSNVQPILMQNAFAAVQEAEPEYADMKLSIEFLNIQIECEKCQHISVVQQYKFMCEKCGTPSKKILQGEELLISKVVFKEE